MKSRRVLVLTLSFGSGHVRAARALAAEIARQAPAAEVRVVDALGGCRWLFRAAYVWPYWAMVRYAPALWGRLFAARLRRRHSRTAPAWAFRLGCPVVFATIERFRPDLIVAVEVAACEMAVIARRRDLTTAAVVNVITDRHAEPAWVKTEVELYAVADSGVAGQISAWGAPAGRVAVCGIPIDPAFEIRIDPQAIRARYGFADDRPIVLLMGGGMGPTHMDAIAARLCASGRPMHVVAVTGHDTRARRGVARVLAVEPVSLSVLGWSDDVPGLMQAASVLVTKPGGLTTAEAAACRVPSVLCDAIPGPEEQNASAVVEAGAGLMAADADEAAAAVISLLGDERRRDAMAAGALALARPAAARSIAALALATADRKGAAERTDEALRSTVHPVLILTIGNGAGHTRAAEAIAGAVKASEDEAPVVVIDVADYMTRTARATHVTGYLWLVKHVPAVWERIDRFQKRQPRTSPAWYYRRGCRCLFDLVRELRPQALLATEVGCCEIAALMKRDLSLGCPLVAVNGEYDADRAWVQPEVDLYCTPTTDVLEELCAYGAPRARVRAWGVPLAPEFTARGERDDDRREECRRLDLSPDLPFILVGGGSEGLGRIEAVAGRLLTLPGCRAQVVVIAGRNERLKTRCERLARGGAGARLRVLGWTSRMPELMRAADLMVSKLGHTFDEAIASTLPLVALEPPPGSERVQYRLLEQWGTGRAVRTLDELEAVVGRLLASPGELDAMRKAASARRAGGGASRIGAWLADQRSAAAAANSRSADAGPRVPALTVRRRSGERSVSGRRGRAVS